LKFTKTLLVAALLATGAIHASAETLTFEGFSNMNPVPSGYGGLNWNNFSVLSDTSTSGYLNGIVSGTSVAYNSWANPASISSTTAFTLNSAFFTGAWNNGLTIHVTGSGATNYSADIVVNTTSPTNYVFNWTGLTSVNFSSSGGTPAGYSGSGAHFAMDNMTINVAAVPEPETYALLLAGLGIIGATARRRKSV
jgi:hypothetical protein